jgi:DNA-binding NtrC family response regulator
MVCNDVSRDAAGKGMKMHEPLDALIVSDRTEHVRTMVRILDGLPIKTYAACTLKQAEQVLSHQPISVIFCDERLPGGSYRKLLNTRTAGKRRRDSCFVVTLQTGEWEEYLEALHLGAFEAIRCPIQPGDVEDVLAHWTRTQAKPMALQQSA